MKKYFDFSKVELGADGKVEFNDPSPEELNQEQNAADCRNYLICSDGSNYGSSCTNTNWCGETLNAIC